MLYQSAKIRTNLVATHLVKVKSISNFSDSKFRLFLNCSNLVNFNFDISLVIIRTNEGKAEIEQGSFEGSFPHSVCIFQPNVKMANSTKYTFTEFSLMFWKVESTDG